MSDLSPIRFDGKPIGLAGLYSDVPIQTYHGGKLCIGPSISSSGLRTIFNDSPMDYWVNSPLNENRIPPDEKEKEALVLGRAAHHINLGEGGFQQLFVPRPEIVDGKPWQSNRTACREWTAAQVLKGLSVLTDSMVEKIRGIAGVLEWQKGLEDSGLANSQLVSQGGLLGGLIEHTIVAQDAETGVWLLSRPDAIPVGGTIAADLKTTTRVDYDSIRRTLETYRYDMQAALARRLMREVCGIEITEFAFVFVMSAPPHAVNIVTLKPKDMDEADLDLRSAIRTFAHCLETKRWPGPAGTLSDGMYVGLGNWARENATLRRKFLEQEAS